MAQGSFDERYKLVPTKMSSLKAKQPKRPPPKELGMDLKDDPNMSKEQREIRGMFKKLGRALHNFARMLKKGRR
nr:hypothetical protein [Tanacetum cinerariifolium]